MSLKNAVLLFFLRIFKRESRHTPQSSTHYLIVSTTALGDTMWSTPALYAIKKKEKDCRIAVLTSVIGSNVLKDTPYIDELFVYKKPYVFSLLTLFLMLRKKSIDKIILFHTSQRAILPLCYLIGANEIIASKGMNKGLDTLLTKAQEQKHEHEIIRRLRLSNCLSNDVSTSMQIFLSDDDRYKAHKYLKNKGLVNKSPLIAMHPGAKDIFKQWPKECFVELGKWLKNSYNCSILITGGPQERSLTEYIASQIPDAVALTDSIDIKVLAAIIEHLSLFITNDTGPMHVAFAMRTPTVSLFTVTDHTLCGPLNIDNARVIQKHKTCTPCLRKKCMLPFCMLQIGVKEVQKEVQSLLKKTTP